MRDDRETLGNTLVDSAEWERRNPLFRELLFVTKDEDGNAIGRAHPFSAHERNAFFVNSGDGRSFEKLSPISGADTGGDSRALALLDYDRDGDTDLALTNANAPSFNLFRTEVPNPGNFLALRLTGGSGPGARNDAPRLSNRDAIGARVTVTTASGNRLTRTLNAGEGYGAQNSKTLLIGLGTDTRATSLEIRWPGGLRHTVADGLVHGSLLRITETSDGPDVEASRYKTGPE